MNPRNCILLLIVFVCINLEIVKGEGENTTTTKPSTKAPGWSEDNYDVEPTYNRYDYRYGNNGYDDDDGYGNNKYDDDDGYGKKKSYNNKGYGKKKTYDDDDDDYNYDSSKYAPSKRQKRVPDEYGNMNIYFREPSSDGKRKRSKRMIFPVHRFKKGRFPPLPPLISFLPYLPIFADKLTKQTIIFSPTGGLYIIPPVINMYGQMFSIAELIASGYCSLVSSGVPPPPAVNVAPLVGPGAVTGPGIPPANTVTGGFKGGVQTQFGQFSKTNGGRGGY